MFEVLFTSYGYDNTWQMWNIPTMSPHFADLRTITGGALSHAQGLDPMMQNPGDPWNRPLNYPRIWQALYYFDIHPRHTIYIGITLITLFLVGLCLVLPNASYTTLFLVMAAVLSPATLLGVERGNIDLLMFFGVALAVFLMNGRYIFSAIALFMTFVLKLFPIFAFAVLLKAPKKLFIRYLAIIVALVGLYVFFTYSDIVLIREGTPQSTFLSYGLNVFWMQTMKFDENLGFYTKIFAYVLLLLSFVAAFFAFLRKDFSLSENPHEILYFDAFRAGAAIYVGTFILGNNWDYRLMFLILTLPQLVLWSQHSTRSIAIIARLSLISILVSMWYMAITQFGSSTPSIVFFIYYLDEAFNWIAFSSLLYLFFWSIPDWMKMYSPTWTKT